MKRATFYLGVSDREMAQRHRFPDRFIIGGDQGACLRCHLKFKVPTRNYCRVQIQLSGLGMPLGTGRSGGLARFRSDPTTKTKLMKSQVERSELISPVLREFTVPTSSNAAVT